MGATGETFDCSGFTQWCYKKIGISIPRTASAQSKAGKPVDLNDRSKWKAGDLLCRVSGGSNNHVVMYIGNNQIIHSPQTGDVVKIQSVDSYRKGKHIHMSEDIYKRMVIKWLIQSMNL